MSSKLYKEIQSEFYNILENKLDEIFKNSSRYKTINVRKYDSYLNGIEEDVIKTLTKKADSIADNILSEFEDNEIKLKVNKILKELLNKIYYDLQLYDISYDELQILLKLAEVSRHLLDDSNIYVFNKIIKTSTDKVGNNYDNK